jgi:hypothetical protein
MFSRARWQEHNKETMLIFSEQEPHPIGSESDEYKGKLSDELPNVQMVMEFNNPESVAALIHSLIELQKELFNKDHGHANPPPIGRLTH